MKKRIVLCILAVMLLLAACDKPQSENAGVSGSDAQLQNPVQTPVTSGSTEKPGEDTPAVSNPPATNPPATNPPATNPPATNPPATNPPATNPPATNPPATNPPATNPPATNPTQSQPHVHAWSAWTIRTAATCTSAGSKECVCTGCGEKQTSAIPATGHSFGDWKVTKAVTCEVDGEETRQCTNCTCKETRAIASKGTHTWGKETVVQAPTCSKSGTGKRQCSVCKKTQSTFIAATGVHTFGEWINTSVFDCERGGTQARYCTVCQKKENRTLPGGDHTWGAWKVLQQVTCNEFGRKGRTCTVCGAEDVHWEMPTGQHQYTAWKVTYQPPCGGVGQEMRGCLTCDLTWQREFTAPVQHKWGEWKVVDPAPYCVDGSEARTCANCSLKQTRVLKGDPNKHLWKYAFGCTPECGKPATGSRTCALCVKRETFNYDRLPHNFDEGDTCKWCGLQDVKDVSAFEKEVVRLVNLERSKKGLPALIYDSKLSQLARMKAEDMRKNNYFSHYSPTYGYPDAMLNAAGYKYTVCGENIAYGQITPEAVVEGWMNSPGHRANILNASYTRIGVGLDCEYRPYWSQLFAAN